MVITPSVSALNDLSRGSSSPYLLSPEHAEKFQLEGAERHLGTLKLVDVQQQPFAQALRISTRVGATQEWHVRVATDLPATVQAGSTLLARFWVRCVETTTGQGVVGFTCELNHGADEKLAEKRLSFDGEWIECFVPFKVRQRIAAGEGRICLNVGYDHQTIELGGLSVMDCGTDVPVADLPRTQLSYPGRAATAEWREAAAERIERYRKGNLIVEVADDAGVPIAGAAVHATLRRHTFGFGTAVTARRLNDASPDGIQYRRIVESLFNQATFENDLKWPAVYDGVPPETDQAAEWLRERQIQIRGHNLLWPSWRWLPQQLQKYRDDPIALRRRVAEHVSELVAHFRGQLIHWDVVNEPFSERDLLELLGQDEMVAWFKLARQADPNAKLFLNDYGIFGGGDGSNGHAPNEHADHFYDTLWFLRDKGAPLDGIGIQSHFTADLPSPQAMLATLERFGKLGLPIESTELTINLEDRQLQADYLRDYMTLMFSQPNVGGITLWGFWAPDHWRPHSALFDEDWSIRPIGAAFEELVRHRWVTNTSLETDASGRASIRGFCGSYDVTVTTVDGHTRKSTAVLDNDGGKLRVTIDRTPSHPRPPRRLVIGGGSEQGAANV